MAHGVPQGRHAIVRSVGKKKKLKNGWDAMPLFRPWKKKNEKNLGRHAFVPPVEKKKKKYGWDAMRHLGPLNIKIIITNIKLFLTRLLFDIKRLSLPPI